MGKRQAGNPGAEQPPVARLVPPDRAERVLAFVRIRWVMAAITIAYAAVMVDLELLGSMAVGLPRPFFLIGLPLFIVVYNLAARALAVRGWAVEWAVAIGLVGDLIAVTVGLNGTGGVASWLWTLYPLITLEAAFLTEQRRWTIAVAVAATACYAAEIALEDFGFLPTVITPLTRSENVLPDVYWALKDTWVALVNMGAAIAGLVALKALRRVREALTTAYARLDQQYTALRQLDALKSQFLSLVSHELRTPLAVIQGYTELVEEDAGLSDESRGYLRRAEGAVKDLSAKIDQVLAYTSLADGEQALRLMDDSALEIVAEAVARREATCRAAGLVLLMEPAPDLALRVDHGRVVGALSELIVNACHATPPGGTVGVGLREWDGGRLAFEVWDTGPGMPEAVRQQLGSPFVQPSLSLTEHAPGLGLGLAYARLVAATHGGELQVGDRDGGGAVVRLILPVGVASGALPAVSDKHSQVAAPVSTVD